MTSDEAMESDLFSSEQIGGKNDGQNLLEVSDLQCVGLAPASFVLRKGKCIAIRGASGAGKTILLRAIADLDVNHGVVRLNGQLREEMSAPEWRRKVGYVPAEPGWWADTVGEHYADWDAALPFLKRLGLPETASAWNITRSSTGERQRFGLDPRSARKASCSAARRAHLSPGSTHDAAR